MTADALCAFLILSAFVAFFYGPWQTICVDIARQLLFEQRDRLFDLASAGRLDFRSQQYRTMRVSLERSIRFAHELTLPRLIYTARVMKVKSSTPSDLRLALSQIDDVRIREEVIKIINRSANIMVIFVILRSSALLLFIPFLFVLIFDHFVFTKAGHMIKTAFKRVAEVAQKEAEIYA